MDFGNWARVLEIVNADLCLTTKLMFSHMEMSYSQQVVLGPKEREWFKVPFWTPTKQNWSEDLSSTGERQVEVKGSSWGPGFCGCMSFSDRLGAEKWNMESRW